MDPGVAFKGYAWVHTLITAHIHIHVHTLTHTHVQTFRNLEKNVSEGNKLAITFLK